MSHFLRVKTAFRRKSALVKALQEVGGRSGQSWGSCVEVHEQATNLFGYQNDQRQDVAEIVIRRKYVGGSANDIGFKLLEDGTYEAIISEYDKSSGYNDKWIKQVCKAYAKHSIHEVAEENGFVIESEEQRQDGLYITCESFG